MERKSKKSRETNQGNEETLGVQRDAAPDYPTIKKEEQQLLDFVLSSNLNLDLKSHYEEYKEIYEPKNQYKEDTKYKLEEIDDLLITNDEIDLDKLLCLHILALGPSQDCQSLWRKEEAVNPLTRYALSLPHYILDNNFIYNCQCLKPSTELPKSDNPPVYVHLSVSKKLEKIIHIVLRALKRTNSKKFDELTVISYNVNHIKDLIRSETFKDILTLIADCDEYFQDDVEIEICELFKATNYAVNKFRDYAQNTVFKLESPNTVLLFNNRILEENENYYRTLLKICTKIPEYSTVIPYSAGLYMLQNPKRPSGLLLLSEDAKFLVLITGPQFDVSKPNKTVDLGIYVKYKSVELNKYSDEVNNWNRRRSIRKSLDGNKYLEDNIKQKLYEVTKQKETNTFHLKTKGTSRAKHSTASLRKIESKGSNLLRVITNKESSAAVLLKVLIDSSLEEREYALRPVELLGLGLDKAIIGEKNLNIIEELCNNTDEEIRIIPITKEVIRLGNSLNNLTIPDDLQLIYKEVCDYEILKSYDRIICKINAAKQGTEVNEENENN